MMRVTFVGNWPFEGTKVKGGRWRGESMTWLPSCSDDSLLNISISQYLNNSKGGRSRGESLIWLSSCSDDKFLNISISKGITQLPSFSDDSFLSISDCNWNYFLTLESDLLPVLCFIHVLFCISNFERLAATIQSIILSCL